jgi:hypothetical protein
MRWKVLAPLTALLLAQPAFAGSAGATGQSPTKTQASLDFRIVIPETVQLRSREESNGRSNRFVSQTTDVRSDRIVVTIAKP